MGTARGGLKSQGLPGRGGSGCHVQCCPPGGAGRALQVQGKGGKLFDRGLCEGAQVSGRGWRPAAGDLPQGVQEFILGGQPGQMSGEFFHQPSGQRFQLPGFFDAGAGFVQQEGGKHFGRRDSLRRGGHFFERGQRDFDQFGIRFGTGQADFQVRGLRGVGLFDVFARGLGGSQFGQGLIVQVIIRRAGEGGLKGVVAHTSLSPKSAAMVHSARVWYSCKQAVQMSRWQAMSG